MIKRIYFFSGVFLVVFVVLVLFSYAGPHPVSYHLEILQLEHGWGYSITRNGKPFIFQEYVPAVEGNLRFPDRKSARKTGQLVIKKLRNNQLPVISKRELKQVGLTDKEGKKIIKK